MAFPTTSVLDAFTRADEGPPPSTSWTNGIIFFTSGLQVFSNTCGAAAGDRDGYWNPITPGADSEVYATLTTLNTTDNLGIWLFARLIDIGSGTTDGYAVTVERNAGSNNQWTLARIDNGNPVALGSTFTQAYAVGDSIGLEIVGSTLTAYYKASGGSWTALTTRTDSTYTGAGRIGVMVRDSAWRFDDFGGGTVVPSGNPHKYRNLLGVG